MTELKAGTRGTWGYGNERWPCVVLFAEPDPTGDIVIQDASGCYYTVPARQFTPDPEPPTTVMVEMATEWAQKWANDSPYPPDEATTVYTQAENVVIQACREALKKVGLA